jgi:regulator of protease activity HflC (stomatin/prohibitin superfamily)
MVFSNIAVDILTEEATKYTAYNFFMDRGRIKDDFQRTLNDAFNKTCYANIQFLQLRSVDLPAPFEQAIQESEVKRQDIQKASAELNKVRIEVDTKIKSAEFQKNVTIVHTNFKNRILLKERLMHCSSKTQQMSILSSKCKIHKHKRIFLLI